jgi:hypothetical protein
MYIGVYVNFSLFSGFNKTLIYSTYFRKKIPISNITKIRPLGTELLDADSRGMDRRTDMTKLIVACRNFANASKGGTNM